MKKIKKQKKVSKKGKRDKITKDMGISEILQKYPKAFEVFLKYNLPCIGCVASHFENIEAVAKEFNIEVDGLLKDLNKIAK